MLALTFQIGPARYALDARRVDRVVPRVETVDVPGGPAHLIGVARLLGQAAPVIDAASLLGGARARPALSTRLVLVPMKRGEGHRLVALLVERLTEAVTANLSENPPPDDLPFLSCLAEDARGLIRVIDPDKLLPPAALDPLLQACDAAPLLEQT